MDRPYVCYCGSAGSDPGELEAHALEALLDPGNAGTHGWDSEPVRVTEARQAKQRRLATQQALADAAGVTLAELREALR